MKPEIEILLRLMTVNGIGAGKIRLLISRFGFTERVFSASPRELEQVINRRAAHELLKGGDSEFVRHQQKLLGAADTSAISLWDDDYPEPLKHIYDPPVVIFVRGNVLPEDRHSVAVVGTRRPSGYGRVTTERFARELAQSGLTVVSGLAYGVDTCAHAAALDSGGRTFAVLGAGVDVIYPASNKGLAQRIAGSGALISEYPMGTEPEWQYFPQRNRLISGLTLGTLVIEAGAKSGSLITASAALEQNREVFAVPGNIDSANSIGTNELIKQGAKAVTTPQEVIDELRPQLAGLVRKKTEPIDPDLSEPERRIMAVLDQKPMHIDKIAQHAGETSAKALSILLSLELKNVVKQLAGKQFRRV